MHAPPIEAQAYTEILNLYAYYNHCSDDGDASRYVSCFAPDGVLEIPSLSMRIQGHDALFEFKQLDAARRGDRIRRHWNSGISLQRIDSNHIRGRCYLHGYNGGEPGQAPRLSDVGVYDDTLVREEGEWRFLKRVIHMDHSAFTPPGEPTHPA